MMDKWDQKMPPIVGRFQDLNQRIQEVTKMLLKQYKQQLETLKKIVEDENG